MRRMPVAVTAALALSLLGACATTPPLTPEEHRTMHPTPSTPPATPVPEQHVRDQAYVAGGDDAHTLDLTVPGGHRGPRPVVVFIHGGGWEGGSRALFESTEGQNVAALRDALHRRGWATASIDYRLSGDARMPAQLHDVKAAVRWVYSHAGRYGLDRERIAVAGESAGGHLAQLLGTTRGRAAHEGRLGPLQGASSHVVAVVSYYGVSDLAAVVPDRVRAGCGRGSAGRSSPEGKLIGADPGAEAGAKAAAAASPITYVSPESAPTLFIHGRQDCVVPHAQSERAAEALRRAGVATDLVLTDGGHAESRYYATEDMQRKAVDFLATYLDPPADGG
ncbi:alpha/beta hydrolase [Mobilicoccus caccae]|nr:alpha/beta hydrolase [Mobilicoccus caccae]